VAPCRWRDREREGVLTTVVTRLAIDHLRSARVRREAYVGPWLHEPLVDERAPGPAQRVEDDETLSLAFLALIERLSPVERAVYLLHELFGYGHEEIAEVVRKSGAATRQILVRARRHVEQGRPASSRRGPSARRCWDASSTPVAPATSARSSSCSRPTPRPTRTAAAERVRRCCRSTVRRRSRDFGPASPIRPAAARTRCAPPPSTASPAPSPWRRMGGVIGVLTLVVAAGRHRVRVGGGEPGQARGCRSRRPRVRQPRRSARGPLAVRSRRTPPARSRRSSCSPRRPGGW
jgi:hypothetical protein